MDLFEKTPIGNLPLTSTSFLKSSAVYPGPIHYTTWNAEI